MAKGPSQGGTERQADEIWKFISQETEGIEAQSILEYGCGYGRMTARLLARWPEAKITCMDISADAIKSAKQKFPNRNIRFINSHKIPWNVRADLVFTCQVLQHVTDPEIFAETMAAFSRALKPGGAIVVFENVHQTLAEHMRDAPAEDYTMHLPDLNWRQCGALVLGLQAHALIIGRKSDE
jgi:trans-aconitate methyltransferase